MHYKLISLSEQAVIIRLGETFSTTIHDKVQAVFSACEYYRKKEKQTAHWITECVPTMTGVTIYYDFYRIKRNYSWSYSPLQFVSQQLSRLLDNVTIQSRPVTKTVIIPVCYGGDYGPDIEAIAEHNHLSTEEVIHIHSTGKYRVEMMGFSPGFPYLSGMSERIGMQRRLSPRARVHAGSVGIAEKQTGIYPLDSPGGWRLVGKTPLPLFTPEATTPFLLKSGQQIIFQSITSTTFDDLYRKYH